jgi:hypothetical protein
VAGARKAPATVVLRSHRCQHAPRSNHEDELPGGSP